MERFNDNNFCFVCGSQNAHGLKLNFRYDEETDEIVSDTVFADHFQGWAGVLHGGLISTVLDEVMIKAAAHKGFKCVTAELNIRFKKPALLKKKFTIRGKIKEARKRIIFAESRLVDSDNTTIAAANGKFITIS